MNDFKWPDRNTAVLVFHGVGSQYPLATIDQFARTLVDVLGEQYPDEIKLQHCIARKSDKKGNAWNDNFIRITKQDGRSPIDIYEYYWANLTENVMNLNDLQKWVWQVASGAERFYERNREIGELYGDQSKFFTKDGKFRKGVYRSFLLGAVGVVPVYSAFWIWLSSFISKVIPFAGGLVKWIVDLVNKKASDSLTNVIGDLAVYNSIDPKSSFYKIRSEILSGAVDAVKYLIDLPGEQITCNQEDIWSPHYGRVILAGHSLGSQIAFDAINRLTQLISLREIDGVGAGGDYIDHSGRSCALKSGETNLKKIQDLLCGLVTFGSPLDKIAFFLREQAPDEQYLRGQMLENNHSFKQKKWFDDSEVKYVLDPPFNRVFDDIKWYNFYDLGDPISGYLDYYKNVVNKECSYKKKGHSFTHSDYWADSEMFRKIVDDFIAPKEPLRHEKVTAPSR